MKYTPPGSSVVLRTRMLPDAVQFSVSDNGPGIPPQHLGRIFDKFHRVQPGGSVRGVGIGLAICKGIVEAHGGRIWVESHPGDGTTFRFTIPSPVSTNEPESPDNGS